MSLEASRFLSDCRSILRRCWKLVVSTWGESNTTHRGVTLDAITKVRGFRNISWDSEGSYLLEVRVADVEERLLAVLPHVEEVEGDEGGGDLGLGVEDRVGDLEVDLGARVQLEQHRQDAVLLAPGGREGRGDVSSEDTAQQ
jgi:hypothetical protein